jgi:polyisoprenoid-binding protein YceI
MMKKLLSALGLVLALSSPIAHAEYYVIDTEKAHAFIDFRIQHLGFSWMSGRFNSFKGDFVYDENNPAANRISVDIDVRSIDTNHAERDKHLRGKKFLNVDQFPDSSFKSTSFKQNEDGSMTLIGDFTLHGVTKPLELAVEHVGHGNDPWGGYRRGFSATTQFKIADFGIDVSRLGPSSEVIYLTLSIEGIRRSMSNEPGQASPIQ